MTRSSRLSRAGAALLALFTILLLALPVLAVESPSSAPGATPSANVSAVPATPAPSDGAATATPSPVPSAAPSPAASMAPCPIPKPSPTPTPLPPEASPSPTPAPTPAPNLCPADLTSGDPVTLIAWLFTPIFQALFLTLAVSYQLLGDIGIAIIVTTILIRILLVPLFRAQIVSQRRQQLIAPEVRAIQQKFKGNRAKISEETMKLYRERGVSLGSGCLPGLLQLILLIPMYSVFSQGLIAPDISSMLQVFGQPVISIECQQAAAQGLVPCIDPTVGWLGGLDASRPEILFEIPFVPALFKAGNFGISLLAIISALLQVVQTRMMATGDRSDPQVRTMQRMFLILPLFSILYGQILPAGLFIYWIVTTVFSIVQQYLIAGWGALFPLFGWNPAFARDHKPRFAVPAPKPLATTPGTAGKPGDRKTEARPTRPSPSDRAAGTVRPNKDRGRTSRRGRRR